MAGKAALYREGAPAWLEAVDADPLGPMRQADRVQIGAEPVSG